MNNKGQSLVLFVLLIPIVFLIFLTVYDIGNMVLLKNELNDINYLVLDYGLEHMDEDNIYDKLTEIINKNKGDIDTIDVRTNGNKLYIVLKDTINNKLSLINKIDVESSYVGYMEEDKKIIKENK